MFVVVVCICCYGLCLLFWPVFVAMVYVCYYGLYLLLWFMFVIMVCICCYGLCLLLWSAFCYQKMGIWKIVGGVVDWHKCQMPNKRNNHLACRKCMMRIIITAEKPPTICLCLLLWSVFVAMVYVCYYGLYVLLWFMFVIMVCICCYTNTDHNNKHKP
jgi:hypothetical protein